MSGTVLTVTLNAAVDLSFSAGGFAIGKTNFASSVTRAAGGKGNHVARVLASLGRPVIATGFAGGNHGRFIQDDLQGRGITPEFEPITGENRTCMTIVDPDGQTLTELREPGPTVTQAELERFLARFAGLVRRADLVVISGTLPGGVPADVYARLVSTAYRTAQVRCVVDATGQALQAAVRAQPYLVKPNREELEEWAGRPLSDLAAVLQAARDLMAAGPLVVAVSLGPEGLLLVSPEGAWYAVPPAVLALNTVGSGDSLVAGFVHGLLSGLPAAEILRLAVGCGTANALSPAVAVVRPGDLATLRPLVRVERLA